MQCMMMKYQEKVLAFQKDAVAKIFELDQERRKIIITVTDQMKEHLIGAREMLEKAFEKRDKADQLFEKAMDMTEGESKKMSLSAAHKRIESADKDVEAASKYIATAETAITAAAKVCEANAVDPKVVTECVSHITEQVRVLCETIQEIGRQETSCLKSIIDASKEVIVAMITKKDPSVKGGSSTAQINSAANSASAAPALAPAPASSASGAPMALFSGGPAGSAPANDEGESATHTPTVAANNG